jgi:hypothetical protein
MNKTVIAGAAVLALAVAATAVAAGSGDYAFEPVNIEVRNAPGTEIAVRLVHKPTGKPVAGAVITRTSLDMAPAQHRMAATVVPISSSELGVYRFRANFTMAGSWALKLTAKVPGENETFEDRVIFRAKD